MGRRRGGRPVHGWVILDKPLGLTSTQALARVRGLLGADKAGHAGTLDPLASGILPIALGEATKTIPFIQDADKTYAFTIRFGHETETDDLEGAPGDSAPGRPDRAALVAAMSAFVGLIDQVPPAYSAIHVDGARAYDLARAGQTVTLAPRRVRIDRLELVDQPDPDHARFITRCGKGTYVRALARDLARAVGTRGHVVALRRLAVGPFRLAGAIGLEKLAEFDHSAAADQGLHPVQTALDDIPALAVTGPQAERLVRGLAITPDEQVAFLANGLGKAMGPKGLVALVQWDGGHIRPVRVFNLHS